ncbi:hypothetical protein [Aquirufa echingensis]|uniref:Uncharacterized protein n=1 Tax=Aquirufa echingensis TaxID=3096516 RepID=A0ABW6D5Y8_9BACT
MNKALLILIVISLSIFKGNAQTNKRVEFPQESNQVETFTIPIGNKGVILLSQLNKQAFNLSKFSTHLEQEWSTNANIDSNQDYVTHSYDGDDLYLLFSRFKSNSYVIFRVNTEKGKVDKYQIISVDRIEISNFKALNASLFIAGMVNSQPVILYTNLNEKKTRILPAIVKGQAEIQSMDLDTAYQQINVTYSVGKKAKDYQLILKSFDEDGNQVSQVLMKPNDEYAMMNAKSAQINDSLQVVVGTYGHKNTIGSSKGPSSQGLYFQSFLDGELTNSSYTSFTKFSNFFNFLSPKQIERQAKKIKDKEEKGEDLRLDYRLLMHDIIRKGDHYIIVAEAFYPDYKYANFGPYGGGYFPGMTTMSGFYSPWSMMYNPYRWGYGNYGLYSPFSSYYSPWGYRGYNYYGNQQQFDGWVYTHAVIAELDAQGNLLWDHCISLQDLKEPKLIQKLKTSVQDDQIILSYSKDNQIISKIIRDHGATETENTLDIETNLEGDRVKKSADSDLTYWYNTYFLAYGTQNIVNQTEGKRQVFYLNKIQFKP